MTTFAIQCSECKQLDTSDSAPVFSTDSDDEANDILKSYDWQSWRCPSCAASAVYASIVELTA